MECRLAGRRAGACKTGTARSAQVLCLVSGVIAQFSAPASRTCPLCSPDLQALGCGPAGSKKCGQMRCLLYRGGWTCVRRACQEQQQIQKGLFCLLWAYNQGVAPAIGT